ncbi:glycosyltransferase family 4 protein [Thermofilum sp.]|uniref:glycosyltransferase family 4 protein n=1 Tax=Thermofilum sp. TaxID=1961369 RepID=UPI003166F82C
MHLCFVCSHLYPCTSGGAELRYHLLTSELAKLGHKVSYITYAYNGCADSSIDLVPVGAPPEHYDEKGKRRVLPVALFGIKAARTVEKLHCDVVDVSVPYTPALLLPKGSFVLTLHEFWGPMWRTYYSVPLAVLAEKGEKLLVTRPRAIITPSEFVARKVREHTSAPVYPVPLGLPLERYVKYAGNTRRDIDAVAIGRFVPIKGWDRLFKLLKLVDKPLRVAIVGDGPLYDHLVPQLRGTNHEVEILRGASEDEKLSTLSRAKYYLNLSQFEGFSIATLEALACGAHPVVLDTGYNAAVELVQNTGCGTIVKTVDEAAEIIARDPPPCTPDLTNYTLQAFIKHYLKVVEEIL